MEAYNLDRLEECVAVCELQGSHDEENIENTSYKSAKKICDLGTLRY
jgi:hypothetical protein